MILLWLLGTAALAAGFVQASRRRQDVVVRGEVVASRATGEPARVLVQQATVAFRDADGEDVRADVRTRVVVAPGTAVTVRYRRGDLAHARIEHVRSDPILLGVGLAAFAAAGLPAPGGFLLAFGGLFGAIGGWMLRPLAGGVKVRGSIVRVDRKQDDDGDTLWRPVVRYFDREERERVVEYDVWTNGRAPQVGAPQLLWYRPEDPTRILLGSGIALGAIMAGVGVCLAVAAVVVLAVR